MSVAMQKPAENRPCNHSMEHFDFINPLPDLKTDLLDPDWKDFYGVADRSTEARQRFNQNWVAKNLELIDKYQLDTLWWDNGVNARNLDKLKLQVFAHLYNRGQQWGKEVQMITKGNCSLGGHVEDYECQSRGATTVQPRTFEVHDLPQLLCYLTDDNYWPSFDLIWRIVQNTSRNWSNFLFNIGPKPNGTIPDDYRRLLIDAGKWLNVNGEAIYGTRSWTQFGEGKSLNNTPAYTPQDIRFTTKGNTLYAIFMSWPDGEGVITSLSTKNIASGPPSGFRGGATPTYPQGKIKTVEMLGHDGPIDFKQDGSGLRITMPDSKPCDFAYAVKITG